MKKQSRLAPRVLHFLVSLVAATGVIGLAAFGAGPLPPLGPTLNVGRGIWTSAIEAQPVQNQTLHFKGLQRTVTVTFEQNGTAHIQAATDSDLFWAMGYVHAYFRLTQMDLMRRQGEGRLAEILGASALDGDRFQIMLGLERTAKAEWQALPTESPVRQILQAYSQGVNARISEEERGGTLPFMFKLLNYQPRSWTPIDTLVIQGDLTEVQDFSTTPLEYAIMVKTLGYQRTMDWFPVFPPDGQHPYDVGPYQKAGNQELLPSQQNLEPSTIQAIFNLETLLQKLPMSITHHGGESNNWAVNGPKAASGKALMAGDPHLDLTLPAIWYQVEASSPDYNFTGVGIPGIPSILIGYNQHISWSITNVQNESTLFYVEKTDPMHPFQYYWHETWHHMQHLSSEIPVKGALPVHDDVYLTVHGPTLSAESAVPGGTISIDWMGAMPSTDSEALLGILRASTFAQFRDALSNWKAPTLNFVYADDQGNIGMISPGYYPIVKAGMPWLPLPGTGEADVEGNIPFDAVPQVYNPPDHIIFTANQRPVKKDYPYYLGTTWNDFDTGYRANEIYTELNSKQQLTMQDMENMQSSTHDYLATLIVPVLLNVLKQAPLVGTKQQTMDMLQRWDENMDAKSVGASIWWTFWNCYLLDTFQPWWNAYHVPYQQDQSLAISADQTSLDEDIETWSLHDQNNPAFHLPDGTKRNAAQVMLKAFEESVDLLSKHLGNNPQLWLWEKLHTRKIEALSGVDVLSYGPYGSEGDTWTLNAVGSDPISGSTPVQKPSTIGPSWRMIVDWGARKAEGVYPGGQEENPGSLWYENEIAPWWNGKYYPMLDRTKAQQQPGSVSWILSD